MVFSSQLFLFCFLPITLLGYALLRKTSLQNSWLLFASLIFYAYGAHKVVFILMFSVIANWGIALLISSTEKSVFRKGLLTFDIIVNLSYLFYFKYYNFFRDNIAALLGKENDFSRVALPIGISFFTFQAISYCIDVYRDKKYVQKNILNVALYITFFPQLIAGPIVRFSSISKELKQRSVNLADFTNGVTRFIYGLGKKVLIANLMSIVVDSIYSLEQSTLSVGAAWIASIAYSFQILFDFSGYSDMAIGLGLMFGFHFQENFNYPYTSKSISEFWRRWHISLSSWFKDYIYIPLGGNRKGYGRQILNLSIVWICTGIWHGANWTFILWGIIYGFIVIVEKIVGFESRHIPGLLKHAYTLLIVNLLWVFFRSDNVEYAIEMIKTMFCIGTHSTWDDNATFYLAENWSVFIIAALACLPISNILKRKPFVERIIEAIKPILLISIFLLSVSFLMKGSHNPFIYFNF